MRPAAGIDAVDAPGEAAARYDGCMSEQYVASDKRTGVEVTVTGDFPPHPDDRMRIARTTTLFTRLTSTLLATENETERRSGFRAVETQLELADALIRRNTEDVRRLVQQTMESMGVTKEQLQELAQQLKDLSGLDDDAANQFAAALGLDGDPADEAPPDGDAPAGGGAESGEPSADLHPDWPPPPEATSDAGPDTGIAADETSGDTSDDDAGDGDARPASEPPPD